MLLRLCHSMAISFSTFPRRSPLPSPPSYHFLFSSVRRQTTVSALPSSTCNQQISSYSDLADEFPSKQVSEQFSSLLHLLLVSYSYVDFFVEFYSYQCFIVFLFVFLLIDVVRLLAHLLILWMH